MKIVFYTPTASGGHVHFSECLIEGIKQADPNHELVLCTSENYPEQYPDTVYRIERIFKRIKLREEYRSSLHWIISRINHYYTRDRQLLRWAEKFRPDIIHLQQEWFWPLAKNLVKKLQRQDTKVIISVHNLVRHEEHFKGHSALQSWFEKRAFLQADSIIVMSPELLNQLCAKTGIDALRINYVPHFVWPTGEQLPFMDVASKRLQRRVLLFGVMRRNKGIEIFIEALAKARDLEGILAGHCPDKDYAEFIKTRIKETGARIIFHNRYFNENEIPGLYANSSAAVFPYTSFGSQSGALYMAVAHETPVVGTDVGALGATILRGEFGLVAKAGDASSLANNMQELHRPITYNVCQANTKKIKEMQSIRSIGSMLNKIYQEVAISK